MDRTNHTLFYTYCFYIPIEKQENLCYYQAISDTKWHYLKFGLYLKCELKIIKKPDNKTFKRAANIIASLHAYGHTGTGHFSQFINRSSHIFKMPL